MRKRLATFVPLALASILLSISPARTDVASKGRFTNATSGVTNSSSLLVQLNGYWKMDEASGNRADSTANGLTLTDNNTVTSAAGLISNEATFLTANQESLSHVHDALLAPTGSFTLAGWFHIDAATGVTQILVDKSDPTTGGFRLARSNAGNIQFSITGGGQQTLLNVASLFPLSTRILIVAWFDASAGTLNFQVNNGTIQSSATAVTPAYDNTIAFRIGCNSNGTASCITGGADEVALWGRALIAAERTAFYNGALGRTHPFTGVYP